MNSISGPFNSDSAVWFCFTQLRWVLLVGKIPKIHFSSQISKSTYHCNLRKGANSNCISVALTKLEDWIAVFIVECRSSRLNSWNYYELLPIRYPSNVLYHIIKYWNKLTISATKDLDILKWVLAIVTLTSRVNQTLGPNEDCMARRAKFSQDLLTLWTTNHKLWFVISRALQIVSVNMSTVILRFHRRCILPGKQIKGTFFSW